MDFKQAIIRGFSECANVVGRASRKEFGAMLLFNILVSILMSGFILVLFYYLKTSFNTFMIYADFAAAISAFLQLAGCCVIVRRLHDINRSGWWFGVYTLLLLVQIIIMILIGGETYHAFSFATTFLFLTWLLPLLYLLFKPSDTGENRFGSLEPVRSYHVNFPQAIKRWFAKLLTLQGRASRSEFWYFFLFSYLSRDLVLIVFAYGSFNSLWLLIGNSLWLLTGISVLLIFIVDIGFAFAILVRRYHDINRSVWWAVSDLTSAFLLGFYGAIFFRLLVFKNLSTAHVIFYILLLCIQLYFVGLKCKKSDAGENRFGVLE